jgi:iron complex outermembrane receptor protein
VPERLTLVLGAKIERNVYTGVEVQPNVRALWAPSDRQSVWSAVTRGVRTPSALENGGDIAAAVMPGPGGLPIVATVIGRRTPNPEELWATEIGYRRRWSTVSLDFSVFRNSYRHLFSLTPGPVAMTAGLSSTPYLEAPYVIDDRLRGRAYGVEASATWRVRQGWTLIGGYTHLDVDLTSGGVEVGLRGTTARAIRSCCDRSPRWARGGKPTPRFTRSAAPTPATSRPTRASTCASAGRRRACSR